MWAVIQGWVGLTILISMLVSLLGIIAATIFIIRIPADHFVTTRQGRVPRHPALRIAWLILKNTLGAVLTILGLFMTILPGPGLLSILLGLSIMDIPGKNWLMHKGLRIKSLQKTMNWIRRKNRRPPLEFPIRPPRIKRVKKTTVRES